MYLTISPGYFLLNILLAFTLLNFINIHARRVVPYNVYDISGHDIIFVQIYSENDESETLK
jgi:hypothetical protein